MAKKRSKRFSWSWRDIGNGLLMAALGSVVGSLQDVFLQDHSFSNLDAKTVGGWAIAGGISYLGKQLFENSEGVIGWKKEKAKPDTSNPLPAN